jgi:hypothetical protein
LKIWKLNFNNRQIFNLFFFLITWFFIFLFNYFTLKLFEIGFNNCFDCLDMKIPRYPETWLMFSFTKLNSKIKKNQRIVVTFKESLSIHIVISLFFSSVFFFHFVTLIFFFLFVPFTLYYFEIKLCYLFWLAYSWYQETNLTLNWYSIWQNDM